MPFESPSTEAPKKSQEQELMPIEKLTQALADQAMKVSQALHTARMEAQAFRAGGGEPSKKADREVQALEAQFQALIKAHSDIVEPRRQALTEAILQGKPEKKPEKKLDIDSAIQMGESMSTPSENLDIDSALRAGMIEKPENFDILMSEPGYEPIPDDELVEVQTTQELIDKEAKLQFEATNIRTQISVLVDQLNDLDKRWASTFIGPLEFLKSPQGKIREAEIGLIKTALNQYYQRLPEIRKELTDVKATLGFIKRTERQDQAMAA